jgi:hypothetical protein
LQRVNSRSNQLFYYPSAGINLTPTVHQPYFIKKHGESLITDHSSFHQRKRTSETPINYTHRRAAAHPFYQKVRHPSKVLAIDNHSASSLTPTKKERFTLDKRVSNSSPI